MPIRRFTRKPAFRRRRVKRYNRRRVKSTFRNRKRMSKPQRGLNLLRALVTGEQLPEVTFAKMRFVAPQVQYYLTDTSGEYSTGGFAAPSRRTFCINNLVKPCVASLIAPVVNYKGIWNALYSDYLVLGAKCHVVLRKSNLMNAYNIAGPLENVGTAMTITPTPNGYWYFRYQYGPYGHPINLADEPSYGVVAPWQNIVDFLNDTSVSYSRDMRTWYAGAQETRSGTVGTYPAIPSRNVLFRHSTRDAIHLTYRFSAKKMFKDPTMLDPRKNVAALSSLDYWNSLSSTADPQHPVYIRFGYVSFDGSGAAHYSYPDPCTFFGQITIDYFTALKGPIDPKDTQSVSRMAEIFSAKAAMEKEEWDKYVEADDNELMSDPEDEVAN